MRESTGATVRCALRAIFCCLLVAAFANSKLHAQSVSGITAFRVASGLTQPLFVTAPPADFGRLFIVQQNGAIRILNLATGVLNPTPFLTLTGLNTGGEQGLLGMAFDPNYATNGKFYLNFVVPGGAFGNGVTRVSQFSVTANPNIAAPGSEKILLRFDHPQTNHNGGWIAFSPRAGDTNNLYIATGDGGAGNDQGPGHIEPGGNAQSKATLLGKMLRIHVNSTAGTASIPSGNPFVGVSGARPEIWAYGLRNPFRNSFDRQTGTLFIGDVGQSTREEIDVQKTSNPGGGENYGWRVREGGVQNPAYPGVPTPPGAVNPIFDYPRSIGQTVIGGYVYRGQQIPQLRGRYVFADFAGPEPSPPPPNPNIGRIYSLNYNGALASNFQDLTARLFPTKVGGFPLQLPSSLGEDARGELYITDLGSGSVFKIGPLPKGDFNGDGFADILWQNNSNGARVVWLMHGTVFARSVSLGTVATQWSIMGSGDFNGDRRPDILWQNNITGARVIWLMNGTSRSSTVNLPSVSTQWNIAGAADFNRDGQDDILWQNSVSGARLIWLMNGHILSDSVSLGVVPTQWSIAGSSDFTGDGRPDILFENKVTGQRLIWVMNNAVHVGSLPLPNVGTDWSIAGAADFNGDLKADILLQNKVTGSRTIWLMNGPTRVSSVNLLTVSTQWSIRNM
jgi:glucose/arabinose dehydrogenase